MPTALLVALILVVMFVVVPLVIGMVMLLATAMFLLVFSAMVGLPVYLVARHWLRQRNLPRSTQPPLERLKNLYVEGKIDMFEFERRAAALIHVENF
ncbi:MAG: hypothetical protein NVSMB22_25200 [Chloroflexota bacterium]